MAYQDDETGLTTGRPIELYRFIGTYNSYFYTSYSEPITSNGQLFLPTAISRSKLAVGTQNKPENALQVTLPFKDPMVVEYGYDSSPPDLALTLERAHDTNHSDTITMWVGPVTAWSVVKRKASLKVPSLFSYILEGNIPAPRFQAPCNHVLYDSICGVDPALHQQVTTVSSVVSTTIVVAALSFADGEGTAGLIFNDAGESRMIISNVGTVVTIAYPFSKLEIGEAVTLRKGCNHLFDGDCKNKFSNGPNFGGFPLVPEVNPFTIRDLVGGIIEGMA